MYCFNCGKEINEDFKHCPYCGTNLPLKNEKKVPEDEVKNEIIEEQYEYFTLVGRTLSFPKTLLEYNEINKLFYDKAAELEISYIDYYNQRKHSYDSLFKEDIPKVINKTKEAKQLKKNFQIMLK